MKAAVEYSILSQQFREIKDITMEDLARLEQAGRYKVTILKEGSQCL